MAFDKLVGQDSVKKKLGFYLEAYNSTSIVPFLNFVGAKGLGKTEFAREFGRNVLNAEGNKRTFVEINSSTVKGVNQFFEQIYLPFILDKEVTIFFDEAHALPKELIMVFLSIFNTESGHEKTIIHKETAYVFDFKKHSFLFATTESDKIFPPFKDRLITVDFDNYSQGDLSQIFLNNLVNITFANDALDYISSTFRGNARNCVQRVKDIQFYSKSRNINHFSMVEVKDLCDTLSILPEGCSQIEWRILNILRKEGRQSLQSLSARTGLSRNSIQKDHENYLLSKGYIEIDGQRLITAKGCALLNK
jgi:Holliday junction resolvasome RuvABC ATP-dependent DNA helicase subunit